MSHRRRIYVGKISRDTRSRDLEDEFSRFGRIRDMIMRDGFAFITYESHRDADDAIRDMDGRRFDGARLIVEWAKERGERDEKRGAPSSEFQVTIEGLPSGTSWQDLKDFVRKTVDVTRVDTSDGGSRGSVSFRSREDLDRAVRELDGQSYKGEKIRVYASGGGDAGAGGARDEERKGRSRSPSPAGKRSRSRSRSRSTSPSKKERRDD